MVLTVRSNYLRQDEYEKIFLPHLFFYFIFYYAFFYNFFFNYCGEIEFFGATFVCQL